VKKQGEKFVVISGGAGGIGRAAALKLAELEYYPVLLDRDDAAGRKASAALAAAGFEMSFIARSLPTNDKSAKPSPKY
jgi:NAD(P)-dependent dehydrogenase (short-subunit alcohol dehydrogenase family)